jgi:photosystem II stability/assembly factor-like uncharacterized protein
MIRRLPQAQLAIALAAALFSAVVRAQSPAPSVKRDPAVTSLTLFAGTQEGLWRSRHWGTSWERVVADGLAGIGATRFILPMGPRVYAGGEGGLYVSDDFGDSWSRLYSAQPVLCGLASRYPLADPTLFLGTPQGLLKSDDAGRSFRATDLRGTPVFRIEWPGPALVVATGQGVHVSMDSAGHFEPPPTGLPEAEVRALALSSYYVIDPVLFAGVSSLGAYRSSDGARTWQPAGLAGRSINDLVWMGPMLFAATDTGLFRSEDAGKSWAPLAQGLAGRRPYRLLFPLGSGGGADAFLGTDRGIFWTGNAGAEWRASGLPAQAILSLATFPPADLGAGKKN